MYVLLYNQYSRQYTKHIISTTNTHLRVAMMYAVSCSHSGSEYETNGFIGNMNKQKIRLIVFAF